MNGTNRKISDFLVIRQPYIEYDFEWNVWWDNVSSQKRKVFLKTYLQHKIGKILTPNYLEFVTNLRIKEFKIYDKKPIVKRRIPWEIFSFFLDVQDSTDGLFIIIDNRSIIIKEADLKSFWNEIDCNTRKLLLERLIIYKTPSKKIIEANWETISSSEKETITKGLIELRKCLSEAL